MIWVGVIAALVWVHQRGVFHDLERMIFKHCCKNSH